MTDINSLVIIPSLQCELKCDHCCRSSGPGCRKVISDDVLSKVADAVNESDTMPELTISGGEPFYNLARLDHVIRWLPSAAFCSVYIATNGLWAQSVRKRHTFFTKILPSLKELDGCQDIGVSVEKSRDQYHRWQVDDNNGWQSLKREGEEGFEFDNYDRYFMPDMEDVTLSERPEFMSKILPIGRGADLDCGSESEREYCNFDGNDDEENCLTVFPDGRCSACCNGGGWENIG